MQKRIHQYETRIKFEEEEGKNNTPSKATPKKSPGEMAEINMDNSETVNPPSDEKETFGFHMGSNASGKFTVSKSSEMKCQGNPGYPDILSITRISRRLLPPIQSVRRSSYGGDSAYFSPGFLSPVPPVCGIPLSSGINHELSKCKLMRGTSSPGMLHTLRNEPTFHSQGFQSDEKSRLGC